MGIGLRIAGTKTRQGGFTPLVAAGILAGDEDRKLDRTTIISEKPVYVIKHTNEYIIYLLIDRRVKPCDRDSSGILSIALTITRDMQLADGKSPYTLLKEVYDKFLTDYMERRRDGLDSFIDKDIDQSEFASILEQYPLESRSAAIVPMNPAGMSGTLCVPQDKLADLFLDSQYQEFAPFKEIEIGVNCVTMPGLENLEIPRPQIYSVILNGNDISHTMIKPTDTFGSGNYLRNTLDITYDHILFSLSDLLESSDKRIVQPGGSSVQLDAANNRIICNVSARKNMYMLEICYNGGTEYDHQCVNNMLQNGAIRLYLGDRVIISGEIPASLVSQQINISPTNLDYVNLAVKSKVDKVNRKLTVTINLKQKAMPATIHTQNMNNSSRNAANMPVSRIANQESKKQIDNIPDEDVDTDDDNISHKYKLNKKIIFLLVGLVLGMCIGFGSWGIHSFTIGKITNEDSTNICNINERNGLVVKADTLTKDDSINIYEIIKLRKEVGQKSAESNKNKNAGEGVQSPQNAEPKVIKGVEEATGYQDVEDTQTSKDKEQTKAKILQLVNKRDLSACRNHEGWSTHLTQTERLAVEAVFNEKGYIGVGKKEFKNLVKGKSFEDWNELLSFKKEVVKIQSDEKKYKKK